MTARIGHNDHLVPKGVYDYLCTVAGQGKVIESFGCPFNAIGDF